MIESVQSFDHSYSYTLQERLTCFFAQCTKVYAFAKMADLIVEQRPPSRQINRKERYDFSS